MKNTLLLLIISFGLITPAFSQNLQTTIPGKDGRVFVIPPGPNYVIDDAHLESLFIEIKGTEANPANAKIEDGTEITDIQAKTIYIQPNLDNFRLTGNASIKQGESILKGPLRIEFTAANNTMVLEGTEADPAGYEYKTAGGIPVISDAVEIHLIFTEVEDKRVLKTVKSVRGQKGARIYPSAKANSKTMMRKSSGLK